jgi:hypothetical protein
LGVCLLAGCGGGGEAQALADAALAGTWLDVAPYSTPGVSADGDGLWPTRQVTLGSDGAFAVEEYAPERTVTGSCTVRDDEITFATAHATGSASWLPAFTYALTGDLLGLTGPAPEGERTLRLARLRTAVPAPLCTTWLLTARFNADGTLRPLVSSTRLDIATDGTVTLSRCGDGVYRIQRGTLLVTAGHLGLRLPASGAAAGRLRLLGAPRIEEGQLQLASPDSRGTVVYEPFTAPDPALVGTWSHPVTGGTAITLRLRADGTYAYSGGFVQSGTWRSFLNGHLCFSNTTVQRTISWGFKDTAGTTLVLGEWDISDPVNPSFVRSTWTRD